MRLIAALALVLTSPLAARADIHQDRTAESASGKFRLEGRSKDTAAGKREDQQNFEYSLVEIASGKVLWTRDQEEGEHEPSAVAVSDEGSAVIRTREQEIIVLDGKSGKKLDSFQLDRQFTIKERGEYTENDGRWWAGCSRSYFISVPKEGAAAGYFVIRPYWGRRIMVDLASGSPVPPDQVTEDMKSAAQAAEEAWVRDVLGRFAKIARTSEYPVESMTEKGNRDAADLRTAVFLAGAMELKSEIPSLKLLEKCHVSGSYGMGRHDVSTHEDCVRQACQTALRRLGEHPARAPGIELSTRDDAGHEDYKSQVKVTERAAHADDIKKGMTLKEVVTAIGLPDYHPEGSGEILDYDVDGETPITLRIHFDDDFAKVKWIERMDPPAWKKITRRDRGFDW